MAVDLEEPARGGPLVPQRSNEMNIAAGPVVRAAAGDLGIAFRFGGLATLDASGNSRAVGQSAVVLTQVGLKVVLNERWMLPLYFGTGVRVNSVSASAYTGASATTTDAGLDIGAGVEHHFRIWRRISPFAGASIGLTYSNPSGSSNDIIGFGAGAFLGIEYYIADRVSLAGQYMVAFQIAHQSGSSSLSDTPTAAATSFAFQTLAGGALTLTCYF
jgi:hypothetical protein